MNELEMRDIIRASDMNAGKLPDLAEIEKVINQCVAWDRAHPIGTEVIYHPAIGMPPGIRTRTRTGAKLMHGHSAVILIEGIEAWVLLDACEPIEAEPPEPPESPDI